MVLLITAGDYNVRCIQIRLRNKAVARNLTLFWSYYKEEVMSDRGGNYFTLLGTSEVIWRTVSSVVH